MDACESISPSDRLVLMTSLSYESADFGKGKQGIPIEAA